MGPEDAKAMGQLLQGKSPSPIKPWWGQPESKDNPGIADRLNIRPEPMNSNIGLMSVAGNKNGQTYYAPHDSERPAMRALASHVDENGGRILTFNNSGNRAMTSGRLSGQDPNRIFQPGKFGGAGDEIGSKVLASGGMVVAAHNNRPGGSFENDVESQPTRFVPDKKNPFDLVWTAGGVPYDKSTNARSLNECLTSNGVNSLYEYMPPTGRLDGSLSQYVARTAPDNLYANVEARINGGRSDADTTERQRDMLKILSQCAPSNQR